MNRTSDWAALQYEKIQDFVIRHRLFKDQPGTKSHADIVLELAAEALEQRARFHISQLLEDR